MALATQCPHCHTTFRVVHDQLKLRAGLVRCGSCKQIFNGIEHLLRPDQVSPSPLKNPSTNTHTPTTKVNTFVEAKSAQQKIAEPSKPVAPPVDFVAIDTSDEQPTEQHAPTDPLSASSAEQFHYSETDTSSNDPLQRMTLMDFTQVEDRYEDEDAEQELMTSPPIDANADQSHADADSATPDELDRAIEDLQQKPWRSANKSAPHDQADDMIAAESDEPAFVTQARRRQKMGRTLHASMWIASVLLSFGLLGQSTYIFRNQLAAWFPQIKPALITACELINCQVTLPTQIDAVTIESSELQALAPQKNTFALTILLRNYSSTAEAWPNIELTLRDTNQDAIARRIFTPRDYLLPKQDVAKGFAPTAEQPIKIPFELLQLKASGYNVNLFYP